MNELNGTRALLATNLRRDKLLLPICAATFAGVAGSSAAATAGLYPDAASRTLAAELLNATPALVAMFGRVYEPSLGAIGLIKLTGWARHGGSVRPARGYSAHPGRRGAGSLRAAGRRLDRAFRLVGRIAGDCSHRCRPHRPGDCGGADRRWAATGRFDCFRAYLDGGRARVRRRGSRRRAADGECPRGSSSRHRRPRRGLSAAGW